MATYFWDLGFDFNAVVDGQGHCYLQNGFVLIQNGTNNQPDDVPATPVGLNLGDEINFNAFNVTDPLGSDAYSIASGSQISFEAAVTGQTAISPFNNADGTPRETIAFPALSGPTGEGPSVICSGIQASSVQVSSPATFPVYAGPVNLKIANSGRFLMTVTLNVTGPNSSGETTNLIFIVDPEMIIGGVG